MPANLPFATVALLLVASAVPVAAGGGGGRMVIIHSPGTSRVGAADQWRRRRLEDEVAPELGFGLLGAGNERIGYGVLRQDGTGCTSGSQCTTQPRGGSYLRPCTFKAGCPHTPAAGGAIRGDDD